MIHKYDSFSRDKFDYKTSTGGFDINYYYSVINKIWLTRVPDHHKTYVRFGKIGITGITYFSIDR